MCDIAIIKKICATYIHKCAPYIHIHMYIGCHSLQVCNEHWKSKNILILLIQLDIFVSLISATSIWTNKILLLLCLY